MSVWKDISTAPRDGTVVLLWAIHEDEWEDAHDEPRDPEWRPYPGYKSGGQWWLADGLRNLRGVRHWMPLPEAPSIQS